MASINARRPATALTVNRPQRLLGFGSQNTQIDSGLPPADVRITKGALSKEDIETYGLPPNFTRMTDTRRASFAARHGDISVELDALPVDVLRRRVISDVESRIDFAALAALRLVEEEERERLRRAVVGGAP